MEPSMPFAGDTATLVEMLAPSLSLFCWLWYFRRQTRIAREAEDHLGALASARMAGQDDDNGNWHSGKDPEGVVGMTSSLPPEGQAGLALPPPALTPASRRESHRRLPSP